MALRVLNEITGGEPTTVCDQDIQEQGRWVRND
jgi:hypothetical protein